RHDEDPQNHLHDERDGAEDLDVQIAETHDPLQGRGAQRSDQRADRERYHPGGERGGERPAQADDEVMEIGSRPSWLGLEQDLPVPVVVHAPPACLRGRYLYAAGSPESVGFATTFLNWSLIGTFRLMPFGGIGFMNHFS